MDNKHIKFHWQKDALCKQKLKFDEEKQEFTHFTLEDFYIGIGKVMSSQVRHLCNKCPVKEECLQHALHHEKYGYWGGKSEKQRRKIREQEGITYQAPQSEY